MLDFPRPCSASEFRDLEAMILAFFDWNIYIPSPTHYVDLLITDQVLDKDRDLVAGVALKESFDEVRDCLTQFVHYFLDVSMQVLLKIPSGQCHFQLSLVHSEKSPTGP